MNDKYIGRFHPVDRDANYLGYWFAINLMIIFSVVLLAQAITISELKGKIGCPRCGAEIDLGKTRVKEDYLQMELSCEQCNVVLQSDEKKSVNTIAWYAVMFIFGFAFNAYMPEETGGWAGFVSIIITAFVFIKLMLSQGPFQFNVKKI